MAKECLWEVNGRRTHGLVLDATGECSLQVVVVPGNPGASGYYAPYLTALHQELGGSATVYAVSHLGHVSQAGSRSEVFNLDQQIHHQMCFLREQVLLPHSPPAVVLGHSIGAYIALHAARRLEQEEHTGRPLKKVVGLFPFLAVDPASWRQWFLSQLAKWPSVPAGVSAALGTLPTSLQRVIVYLGAGKLDEHAVKQSMRLLNWGTTENAFFLAHHEFTDLRKPPDWRLLQYFGPRAAIVCAPNDTWFPRWKWDQMRDALPSLQALWEPEYKHAFCVSVAASTSLAKKTIALL